MLEIIVSQQIETFNLKTAPIIMTISSEGEKPVNFLQLVVIFPIIRGIYSTGGHWKRYIKVMKIYKIE